MPQLGSPHSGCILGQHEVTIASSERPFAPRQTPSWLGRHRSDKSVIKYFVLVRCPIGLCRMSLVSFSRPHSDLHCAPQYPAVASAVILRCYNANRCLSDTQNRGVPACTCQNGAGTLIARSPANSLHDMRICAHETHSCPTVSTSRPGLWHELRATSIFTICPRPAICRRCVCCFQGSRLRSNRFSISSEIS
jgi:hypothetical protein